MNYTNFARYCKAQGMNLEQFVQAQLEIDAQADAIINRVSAHETAGSGLYHPACSIIRSSAPTAPFLVQALKRRGMEFYDNNSMWRY